MSPLNDYAPCKMFDTQFTQIHRRREVYPQCVQLETFAVIFVTFAGPEIYATRFEVLLAVSIKMAVFCDVTL
jgi:hypothetical protein